jgi:aminopeptidase YwaD
MALPPPSTITAANWLHKLCLEIPTRRTGSEGNRLAADFFAGQMKAFGFEVETPEFDCLDWTQTGAELHGGGQAVQVFPSPYTLGGSFRAPLIVASTLAELEAAQAAGRLLLLRGELAAEPLMPKNFPFYNPDEHRRIYTLVEAQVPLAVLAATARSPEMAGASYPFPLFEDGDFDIPSVYLTEEDGLRLAAVAGREVSLEIRANRLPAKGFNVVARQGDPAGGRIVLMAHIDAKDGSPGAIDNAAGIVTLLLLGRLLAGDTGIPSVEIVAINGEDYYSNPGEQLFLSQNAGRFGEIHLGVNLDGLGFRQGSTSYSLYGCSPELSGRIDRVFAGREGFAAGEPWYQGDHSLFLFNERSALALTSERVSELMSEFVHTPADRPEIVDPARLVGAALALRDLLHALPV